MDDSAMRAGVEHFNAGRFWHAHEAWETLWLAARGEEKELLRGLIQLAAAYHHVQRGNTRGAVRLFDASLRRLEGRSSLRRDLRYADAVRAAARHRAAVERGERIDASELPKLGYNEDSLRPVLEPHASEG